MFCLYISLTPTWSLCHKVMILVNTLQNLGFPSFPSVKFICRQCTYLCLGSNWSFFAIIIKVSSEFWIVFALCGDWRTIVNVTACVLLHLRREISRLQYVWKCAKALSWWVCDIYFQSIYISSYINQKIHDN